jgi:hypothetical protein
MCEFSEPAGQSRPAPKLPAKQSGKNSYLHIFKPSGKELLAVAIELESRQRFSEKRQCTYGEHWEAKHLKLSNFDKLVWQTASLTCTLGIAQDVIDGR